MIDELFFKQKFKLVKKGGMKTEGNQLTSNSDIAGLSDDEYDDGQIRTESALNKSSRSGGFIETTLGESRRKFNIFKDLVRGDKDRPLLKNENIEYFDGLRNEEKGAFSGMFKN
jgi:hypothetical protein